MACIAVAAPPIPVFPPGITMPIFTPPAVPSLKFCCAIPLPIPPIPAVILVIPFPPSVITALNGYLRSVQQFFDLLSFDCPLN